MTLNLTLGQISKIVNGTVDKQSAVAISRVYIDSRESGPGLFVAIAGERFDGHDFVRDAEKNGASVVLVHTPVNGLTIPAVLVDNTLNALQALAKEKRRLFDGHVVGITGSSGKTTTRRILTAILSTRFETLSPIKNFNNHIGLPLTLMGLAPAHQAAVLELGCSDFGEIALLTELADPDVGLVTNVGAAHLEKLGSLEGVAKAKGELFEGMREDTVAIVNMDDPRVAGMPLKSKRQVRFGQGEGADVRLLERESLGIDGQRLLLSLFGRSLSVVLPLLGGHNALNGLAAAAAASMMGISDEMIVKGLALVTPEPGRLAVKQASPGGIIIDDTYNANPNSMRAAIMTLKETGAGKKTIAVLGDMLELGAGGDLAHHEIGRMAGTSGIDQLVTLGEQGRLIGEGAVASGLSSDSWHHDINHVAVADWLKGQLTDDVVVLVKGSRGMTMEKVVAPLVKG